ncbi:MAG: helix-turn-helix domain-containing protein [Thermosynechococcus sp. Uc]|uniref:helix-turn-helix domain-containing protein n=1 Tax=Thermosynechococcus sp. Uc TaxID=3034853 RepID=UPI0019D91BA4|nr:helix-turn-helix domain-containing protein [Thermosynechococcus sp. Uc]MDM7326061.1 helix-turn-helix domain-containing protein [Thermosynechococcus sp. Uc]HIK26225.1 helix-turn-helix domain-containing protein [Thermosynechococcus sp. M46_R2017_013]
MSQRLQARLAMAGISRKSQLRRRGFTRQQANAIWLGELHRLRLETLERLAQVLGVTPLEFLQWFYGEATPEAALQYQALQILEPFLRFWPTAAYAAQQNPAVPAQRILPLVKPVFQLLELWGVKRIGEVGECVPFDPRQHQSDRAPLAEGTPVRITHAGYWWGDRLLLRAMVTPVDTLGQSAPPAHAPESPAQ